MKTPQVQPLKGMTPLGIKQLRACDNCGETITDKDEMLCEKCKPVKRFDFACEGIATKKEQKFRWTVQAANEEEARTECVKDMNKSGFKNVTITKIERLRLLPPT